MLAAGRAYYQPQKQKAQAERDEAGQRHRSNLYSKYYDARKTTSKYMLPSKPHNMASKAVHYRNKPTNRFGNRPRPRTAPTTRKPTIRKPNVGRTNNMFVNNRYAFGQFQVKAPKRRKKRRPNY